MVRPAVGRFDDFGEVVGVRKPGGLGCTTELFEAHGFEVAGPTTAHSGHRPRWIMRRELG
ncbi:hypothetical protein LTI14_02825 [Nesterenkonia sp. YGD6]|uniref:hypothetical protein n=1 Tax=Nesterenkonia sp. YGD6 TaxID=2901231 RepID=UPI001F4D0631|nr:hypothetical protein [Nesterenkonia sp. YGD6]MCH8562156.1 hypothetical protein [Nesterenkonia sp. YGD6]